MASSRSFWWCSNALSTSPRSNKAFPIQLYSFPRSSFLLGMSFSEHPRTIFTTSSAFLMQTSVFPDNRSVRTCFTASSYYLFFFRANLKNQNPAAGLAGGVPHPRWFPRGSWARTGPVQKLKLERACHSSSSGSWSLSRTSRSASPGSRARCTCWGFAGSRGWRPSVAPHFSSYPASNLREGEGEVVSDTSRKTSAARPEVK